MTTPENVNSSVKYHSTIDGVIKYFLNPGTIDPAIVKSLNGESTRESIDKVVESLTKPGTNTATIQDFIETANYMNLLSKKIASTLNNVHESNYEVRGNQLKHHGSEGQTIMIFLNKNGAENSNGNRKIEYDLPTTENITYINNQMRIRGLNQLNEYLPELRNAYLREKIA